MNWFGKLVVSLILTLLASVLVMWSLGAAHDSDTRVPALGYETILWLVIGSRIVIRSATTDTD